MYRALMRAKLTDNLQEFKGDPMSGDPLQLDGILNEAANYIADKTLCMYEAVPGNLVANQAIYNTPWSWGAGSLGFTEATNMSVYDSNGKRTSIPPVEIARMYASFPTWPDQPASVCPRTYMVLGESQMVFYPAPNYTSNYDPTGANPGGWVLEGYCKPGRGWDADNAECPIPTGGHVVVVVYATILRISQNPSPMNVLREDRMEKRFKRLFAAFYTEQVRINTARRVPAYTGGMGPDTGGLLSFGNPFEW